MVAQGSEHVYRIILGDPEGDAEDDRGAHLQVHAEETHNTGDEHEGHEVRDQGHEDHTPVAEEPEHDEGGEEYRQAHAAHQLRAQGLIVPVDQIGHTRLAHRQPVQRVRLDVGLQGAVLALVYVAAFVHHAPRHPRAASIGTHDPADHVLAQQPHPFRQPRTFGTVLRQTVVRSIAPVERLVHGVHQGDGRDQAIHAIG